MLLEFLNMLIFKMNCVLYSSLVTKSNQISKNVDTTAHCPITPPTKTNQHWLNQIQKHLACEKTDSKFSNPWVNTRKSLTHFPLSFP